MTSRTKHNGHWKNEHGKDLESCLDILFRLRGQNVRPEVFNEAEELVSRLTNVTYKRFLSDVVDKYRHIKSEEEAGLILHLIDQEKTETRQAKLDEIKKSRYQHSKAYELITGRPFNASDYRK